MARLALERRGWRALIHGGDAVIARLWKARATRDGAQAYDAYFTRVVVPELRAIRGFERAMVLHETRGDLVEVAVITWWASLDAIRAFAGEVLTTAVVHEDAARLLIDFDPVVSHHELTYEG